MAYLDAILNSELLSYIIATILITIAVWLFSGLYSCATCSKTEREEDGDKTNMSAKSWFKLLLGSICAACSGLLIYRNITSTSLDVSPFQDDDRTPFVKTGGLVDDSDSEDSSFN